MNKTIIIDERTERKLLDKIYESAFYPRADLVNDVKKYLDKHFRKRQVPSLDNKNGHAKLENYVVQVLNGVELDMLNGEKLLRFLDDEFNDRITDDDDRKRFLKQVIIDWFNNKIKNGLLTVNKV